MSWDVFIAYARQDGSSHAEVLAQHLRRQGFRAFLDVDVPPGADWDSTIRVAHREARLTVAVLTRAALDSAHVRSEIQRALDWRKARGIPLVPWPIEALPPEEWPSGLSSLQAVSGTAEAVASRVTDVLRPAASGVAAVPDSDVLDAVADWLQKLYPVHRARELLMRDAGVERPGDWPWRAIVGGLGLDQVVGLVQLADDAPEAAALIERLRRGAAPAPAPSALDDALREQFDLAAEHLRAGRFARAEELFRALVTVAETAGDGALAARAAVNLAAALNGQLRLEEARERLLAVDPVLLSESARVNLGRYLVGVGEHDKALAAAPESALVKQMVALRRDRFVPPELVPDADVRLSAAHLLVEQGRAATAVTLALDALTEAGLLPIGRRGIATVLVNALARSWYGEAAEPVPDPGAALAALRRLLAEAENAWPEVGQILRGIELEQMEDEEPTELPDWVCLLRAADSRADLEAVAGRYPSSGLVLWNLAGARLAEGDAAGAVEAAERAFRILPGRGQRLRLVEALAAAARRAEARALFAPLEGDPDVWRTRWRLAERGGDALAVTRAWTDAKPDEVEAWIRRVDAALRVGEVSEAREAAHRLLPRLETLTLDALRVLHAAARTGEDTDASLARALAHQLAARFEGDPVAEALRLELVLASGRGSDRPIDYPLLEKAGMVTAFTVDEMMELLRERARAGPLLDRAWAAGAVGFESWAALRAWSPGLHAVGVLRGEAGVAAPCPPPKPAAWEGRRCLLGALAIELLVGLNLHEELGARVGEVVVFEDVWRRVMNGATRSGAEAWQREDRHVRELWSPIELKPNVEEANIGAEDVHAIRAWLGELGRLPPVEGEPWRPPAVAVIGWSALAPMAEFLQTFVDACEAQGVSVAVETRARALRQARHVENRLRAQAEGIAFRMYTWFGDLEKQGKLARPLPMPPGPELPPRADGAADPAWVARAFAAREAMLSDPDLVLVSAELSEMGALGVGPPILLEGRAWTNETRAAQRRYQSLAVRFVTLPHVVRALAPAERKADALGWLARAGYVDALGGADVLELFDRFRDLRGVEPRERLLGLVRWGRGERQPHHAMLALRSGFQLVADAFRAAWLGDRAHPEAARFTASLLDTVAEMDAVTGRRYRLLEQGLFGAALASFEIGKFVEAEEDGHARIGAESVGGRMWRQIGEWCAADSVRVLAMSAGIAAAIRVAVPKGATKLRGIVAAMLVSQLPARPEGVDLSGPAWAAALGDPAVRRQVEALQVYGRAVPAWVAAAIAAESAEVDGLDLVVNIDGVEIRIPVEAALDARGSALALALAEELWIHDGALSEALQRWAEDPTAPERALHVALARSPLRLVRADPTAVLAWSRYSDRGQSGPRTLRDLAALLSESGPGGGATVEALLESRLEAWKDRDRTPMLRQLARIPGCTVGVASGIRSVVTDDDEGMWLRTLEGHADHSAGSIAEVVVDLALVAGREPTRLVGTRQVTLATLGAELAAAALTRAPGPPLGERERSSTPASRPYADLEPGIVRACAMIVDDLGPDLNPGARIWLSWRLYSWLADQILYADDPGAAARALAAAAPPPRDEGACVGDLYDPCRLAIGRVDFREMLVLQALGLIAGLAKSAEDGEPVVFDWPIVFPTLRAVASRPFTPDERHIREHWQHSSLSGATLVAPDLARRLVLLLDHDVVSLLGPEEQLTWLADALRPRCTNMELDGVRDQVLLAFASRPHALNPGARDLLIRAFVDPSFLVDSFARRGAAVVLAAAGFPELDERAREVLLSALGEKHGEVLASEWLLAQARRGRLEAAVVELRAELRLRGLDELAYLRGLSRVAVSDVRAAAAPVLRALAAEPALAEGLSEILRYALGQEARA